VDAAREQWWIGLRGAELEHYSSTGRKFGDDEKFYRMGFESALHARSRCKEYDQVLGEMTVQIEELERQHLGANVGEPFRRGMSVGAITTSDCAMSVRLPRKALELSCCSRLCFPSPGL